MLQIKAVLLTQPRTIFGQAVSQLYYTDWELLLQDGLVICTQLTVPEGKEKLNLVIPISGVALLVLKERERERDEQSPPRISKAGEVERRKEETSKVHNNPTKGTNVRGTTKVS